MTATPPTPTLLTADCLRGLPLSTNQCGEGGIADSSLNQSAARGRATKASQPLSSEGQSCCEKAVKLAVCAATNPQKSLLFTVT